MARSYGFTNLETEGDSKVIMDFLQKCSLPSLIMLHICRLAHDLNIFHCGHIYRESNRITYCLAKKCICVIDSNI